MHRHSAWRRKIGCVSWKSDEINAFGSTGFKQAVNARLLQSKNLFKIQILQNALPNRFGRQIFCFLAATVKAFWFAQKRFMILENGNT
jgi:hypothetical protein